MARLRIEPGGKLVAGIVILCALLFLFFKIKWSAGTQRWQRAAAPTTMAQQTSRTVPPTPQREISASNGAANAAKSAEVQSQHAVSATSGREVSQPKTQVSNSHPSYQAEVHAQPLPFASNTPIRIFFDFNRASINKNVYCIFDRIEEIVRQKGWTNLKIVVEGNADSIGTPWYNKTLSEMRAARVADSLSRRLGIPLKGIELVANGSSKPVASNETRDGRAENRRTEILLYH